MQRQYSIGDEGLQASPAVAQSRRGQLTTFVHPLLSWLDARLDLRLVHTFLATLHVLLEFRHRNNGLLLSELGAYLASPAHAKARTKRLSTLVRSARWSAQLIEHFLWSQAENRLATLEQAGEEGLRLGDESVIEKPESIAKDRLVCGALQQSASPQTHQARLLQSSWWPAHFCPGHELADLAPAWEASTSRASGYEVVDDARPLCSDAA